MYRDSNGEEGSRSLLNTADRAKEPALFLHDLMSSAGIEPYDIAVVRHRPKESKLQKVVPWIVSERPELFCLYQSFQEARATACFRQRRYLLSFLGLEPGRGVFAGAYRIGAAVSVSEESFRTAPGQEELFQLGQSRHLPSSAITRFDLDPMSSWHPWVGCLTIGWPGKELSWFRRAEANTFPIIAISEENRFVEAMPAWPELNLTWAQLQMMPQSWKARLAEWRGVYLVFDTERKAGYVGSAAGQDNILGRWWTYGRTGHGGNIQLKASDPTTLRFSILQRTSPDLPVAEVVALETNWKARLHTREFGLNSN